MAAYSEWLRALTRHFFGPQFQGQRVRLITTRGVLDQHFGQMGGTNGFLAAMHAGPDWPVNGQGVRSMHEFGKGLYTQWITKPRRSGYPAFLADLKDVPPFLPYLCLLCLAWTENEDEDLADHAFFRRLSGLFPQHDLTHHLAHWGALWDGLAIWSENLGKTWGHFVVERLGGMVHVGIPKAQVIFTPGKLEQLPDLFLALNISPSAVIPAATLAKLIVAESPVAQQYLSPKVFAEIARDSDIGKSAVTLLLEHLENWDGAPSVRRRREGGTGATTVSCPHQLLLVLEATDGNPAWRVRLGTEEGKDSEMIDFPGFDWRFRSVEASLALVTSFKGAFVDAGSYVAEGDVRLDGIWRDEEPSSTAPSYEFKRKKSWLFDCWVGSRLVESQRISNPEGVYALISPSGLAEWNRWREARGDALAVEDYTETGLPAGYSLFYVRGLAQLDLATLSSFPGRSGGFSQRPRAAWLTGGTRIKTSASRRVYAEYDPPMLHVQAPQNREVVIVGATASLISGTSMYEGMPGDQVRSYSLSVNPGESVVIATVTLGDGTTQSCSFGVGRDGAEDVAPVTSLRVNQLGQLSEGPGVLGASTTRATAEPWDYGDWPTDAGTPLSDEVYGNRAMMFLESLAHNSGRLTIQEYRRRAMQVGGAEYWQIGRETRWLAALGHLEIQVDSQGRWSHVHPVPRQLCMLPTTNRERFQGSLCGCGTFEQLRRIIDIARMLEIEALVHFPRTAIVPPRILLLHRELAAFEMLAAETGLAWTPHPTADLIADYSADLNEWLNSDSNRWHDHEAPDGLLEYVPTRFGISAQETNPAPARLYRMEDPYTRSHFWHVLVKNPAITDPVGVRQRHAFVRDPAWAKWKTHLAVADGDRTLVPYFPRDGVVVVPTELHFPYLLARSLCLCSGLPPRVTRGSVAYADSATGVLPSDMPRYEGECWSYRDIPRAIATKVAAKVLGELKDINS
jgi:hypothetical protein